MALLYSRDALAEILTKVARVVSAIGRGVMNPDLPRAERIAQALEASAEDYRHLPETILSGATYIHILSGVVHQLASPRVLKCGRKVTANMRSMGPEEAQDTVCQQCAA